MKARYRSLLLASLSLSGWLFLAPPSAQSQTGEPPVPLPSPTETTVQADKKITAIGKSASSEVEAARLSAVRQLMQAGAELQGTVSEDKGGFQFFRVNSEHPQDSLLGWALRAEEKSQPTTANVTQVTLTSPPLNELGSAVPHLASTTQVDIDNDGKPETVGAGYDGHIYVLRNTGGAYETLAVSPCLASYTHVVYTIPGTAQPSWEQVRLTRLTALRSVEVVAADKVRVVAELSSSEEVAGHFLGRATEEREILIRLNQPGREPNLTIEQPADFLQTKEASVNLRGQFRAFEGLNSARLRYNGRPYWQSPEGLSSKRLKMDVVVPLLPGWNSAQVQMIDNAKQLISREVLIHRDAPPPAIQPGKRRALLIGVGNYESPNLEKVSSAEADVESVKRFIMGPQNGAGFALQNVFSLKGQQASRASILGALRQLHVEPGKPGDQERTFTLIYFSGLTSKSVALGGKALLPYDARGVDDGALRPKDLIDALGPLGNQDVLLVLDTAQSGLAGAKNASTWLDSQDFCAQLESQGWAVIASGDLSPSERGSGEGGRLTKLLLNSLAGSADADNDGLVEFDELYRNLFDLWMAQGTAAQAPIRRGNLLGRTPVVAVHR